MTVINSFSGVLYCSGGSKQLAPLAVDGPAGDTSGAGDLAMRTPGWAPHAQAHLLAHCGDIGLCRHHQLGPLVDGLDRADFFAYTIQPVTYPRFLKAVRA